MSKIKIGLVTLLLVIMIATMSSCKNGEGENSMNQSEVLSQQDIDTDSQDSDIQKTEDANNQSSNNQKTEDVNNQSSSNQKTEDTDNQDSSIRKDTQSAIENDCDNLCKENEEILLSFKIADSDKLLSICISKNDQEYIVYRYGKKDAIELQFPDNLEDSWGNFTYSYYFRGGGVANEGMDSNYLIFENAGFKYQIYQEYASETDKTKVGVIVTDLSTNKETVIEGRSDTIEGSLINLRDNKKIKIEIQ